MRLAPPPGWSTQLGKREPAVGAPPGSGLPLLHAATFPLPPRRGDYGSGAVVQMGSNDLLVVLMEFSAGSAGAALFSGRGLPRPAPADFSPHQLQRTLPGQSGYQRFFVWQGRPFCLYVVLGSHSRRARLIPRLHQLLDGLSVTAAGPTTREIR
jgi:hypothetical protein